MIQPINLVLYIDIIFVNDQFIN